MQSRQSSKAGLAKSKSVVNTGDALTTGLGDENFYLPVFQYLSIPKNTAILDYVSIELVVPVSMSEKIWIEFPSGCAGLVGVQLWHGTEQIFPLPSGVWFKSNGFVFGFRLTHLFDRDPFTIQIRGYNLDDTYQHTVWISIELHGLPKAINDNMKSFLNTLKG